MPMPEDCQGGSGACQSVRHGENPWIARGDGPPSIESPEGASSAVACLPRGVPMLRERIEGKWIDCFAEVFARCGVAPGDAVAILSET